jgi:D-cysteine desulfhydrase/L-cysteate sulfo-lyase
MAQRFDFPAELGRLAAIARTPLFAGPTPLQAIPNLADFCGAQARLYVKRDDCTELAFGGNKVRQLEFYMGKAREQDADTILITGAVQSNFARLAAAAARKLGMDCHIQLEQRVATDDAAYHASGNVLLDRLLGATLHSYPKGEDEAGADRQLGRIAEDLAAAGRRPYIIPLAPGHAPLGVLGYVVAAWEILDQFAAGGLIIDEIIVASGSGATQAGLLFGLRALGSPIRVSGICVRRDADSQRPRIETRCREIAELLALTSPVQPGDIILNDDYLAPGYGKLGAAGAEAILTAARTEALMLDPTYTAKAMAGFIERAKKASANSGLVFLHTGGSPALFAYQSYFDDYLAPTEGKI